MDLTPTMALEAVGLGLGYPSGSASDKELLMTHRKPAL